MKVKIEFTKDFADKKTGDVAELDSMLASRLVTVKKVAKLFTEKKVLKTKISKK